MPQIDAHILALEGASARTLQRNGGDGALHPHIAGGADALPPRILIVGIKSHRIVVACSGPNNDILGSRSAKHTCDKQQ